MSDAALADTLSIVHYPHPALRHVSKPVRRIDAELFRVARRMFELMYEHNGIGLAANQVNLPYRMFVLNLKGEAKYPDEERVFVNPMISRPKGLAEKEEGCLSLPGLYANVKRPDRVTIQAYDLQGKPVREEATGLLARAVQHEVDHLDGVLFIDRLDAVEQNKVREDVIEFEVDFASRRRVGEIPDDATIAARLKDLEQRRT